MLHQMLNFELISSISTDTFLQAFQRIIAEDHSFCAQTAWCAGWWEQLVQLTKELLRRTLGKACLTYRRQVVTVLFDYESVINFRQLTYKEVPLTPSHFLHYLRYF